jgi:PAS domain S-box-containing protein
MHRRTDGKDFPATVLLTRVDLPGKQFIQATVRDVTEHKLAEIELRRINEEMDLILGSITSIIIGVSVKDRITHWNSHAASILGVDSRDVLGKQFYECGVRWDWNAIYEGISKSLLGSVIIRLDDIRYTRTDGKEGILGLTINPLYREGDILAGFMILGRDLTERRVLEYRLLQARKLEAIGQLAAGVAHEINSPLQYVGDNLRFITKSLKDVIGIQKGFLEIVESSTCKCADAIKPLRDSIDLDYLMKELPKAAEQSLEGVERVSKIVKSMKAFAHPGTGSKLPAQINRSIENTATVSRNEWKYDCELELNLDPSLPPVPCFEAELNQVVLNLIVNAVDAVKEAKAKGIIEKGFIAIRTFKEGKNVLIEIEDNGMGIPDAIQQRVFDPFFTTKEVGKGTGQGLSISHSIIVEKHGGSIDFRSTYGKGTTFTIALPLEEF